MESAIHIRPETAADQAQIETLIKAAL